ncbi:hypothetical protein LCGC14_2281620, partial [marine sediment metagenome]
MKAKLEVLTKNELDVIYQTSMDMLEKIGVSIEDDELIELPMVLSRHVEKQLDVVVPKGRGVVASSDV